MDANELMRLMNENLDRLSQIVSDSQNGPPEVALVAEVMGPMLLEFQAMKDQLYLTAEQNTDPPADSSDGASE